jgi:hypothetical protein
VRGGRRKDHPGRVEQKNGDGIGERKGYPLKDSRQRQKKRPP